jgi:hypothetical protein
MQNTQLSGHDAQPCSGGSALVGGRSSQLWASIAGQALDAASRVEFAWEGSSSYSSRPSGRMKEKIRMPELLARTRRPSSRIRALQRIAREGRHRPGG